MKTQTLNTVFTGNAGPLMGEVNRLTSSIGSSLSGIASRGASLQSLSRTTGMGVAGAGKTAALEGMANVPGLTDAMAEMSRLHTSKLGGDAGVNVALRKMNIDRDNFWKQSAEKQAVMLASGLSKMSERDMRITAGLLPGGQDVWVNFAKQQRDRGLKRQQDLFGGLNNNLALNEEEARFWEVYQRSYEGSKQTMKQARTKILSKAVMLPVSHPAEVGAAALAPIIGGGPAGIAYGIYKLLKGIHNHTKNTAEAVK